MTLENFLEQNPKKHLIFDFDETIVYLKLPWHLWAKGVKSIGYDYDHELVESFPGWADGLANALVKKYGKEVKEKIDKFSIDFETKYLKSYEINSEIIKFINNNTSKYKNYLWSSNCSQTIEKILKELTLLKHFSKIVTRDRVEFTKPYPDGFELINPNEENLKDFLFIGDSVTNDGGGAKAAGIEYFRVKYF